METKIKSLIVFVMLSGASLTILFALPHTQPNSNARTQAQVETVPSIFSTSSGDGGMRTRADTVLPSLRYGSNIDRNQPSVTVDRLDIRSVTMNAPNQIGVNRSVAVSPTTRPQKFVNPDGSQIIVLVIKSFGASGIGVHFRNFELARGEEVYVYGPAADSIVCGPYTDKGPWGSGEFWSATMSGDTAIIEFYTRSGENEKPFEVFEISHIFPELGGRLLPDQSDVPSLPCEIDASCYGDAEKNAVGRIVFNNNGVFVCTGTLLNDCAEDHIPYFLTANHCVSTQTVAQTVEVYWFYQTTSCNSGVLRTWVHSPPGANLLATQSSNDFCLLRLQNNAPGGAVFSGWTSAAQPAGTSVFGLHHPDGYIPPSVPSYLRRATGSIVSTNVNCADSGLVNGYIAAWTSGTAEEGSSGSSLFTSNGHYVVGVLSCGPFPPTCNNPDGTYSKFANFYPQIRPYICSGTPIAVPYDFNNDGHSDYLLYNSGTRQTMIWYLNDNVFIGSAFGPTVPGGWQAVGVADFNRDAHPDYLLISSVTRQTVIWYMNDNVRIGSTVGPTLPAGWTVGALGDFNVDGYPDYVLHNVTTGGTVVWYMRNNVHIGSAPAPTVPGGWTLAGVADFSGDRHADYLLFNVSTHATVIWYMSGTTHIGSHAGPTVPQTYQVVGLTDFDRNGRPDYLLYNSNTRQTAIWYLNNYQLIGSANGPTLPIGWNLVAP